MQNWEAPMRPCRWTCIAQEEVEGVVEVAWPLLEGQPRQALLAVPPPECTSHPLMTSSDLEGIRVTGRGRGAGRERHARNMWKVGIQVGVLQRTGKRLEQHQ